MRSLQHLTSCNFVIVLSCALSVKAIPFESLEARKEVSANIFCGNDLPDPHTWPENIPPRSTYTTMVDLCAFSRDRPNVGCLCDSPYDHVECRPQLGNPGLRAHFLQDCMYHCFCRHTNKDPFDTSGSGAGFRWVPARGREGGPNPFADIAHVPMPISRFAVGGQGGQA